MTKRKTREIEDRWFVCSSNQQRRREESHHLVITNRLIITKPISVKKENNACKFFIWVDPPTCPRGLVYGRQLQKKIKDLQEMEEDLRRLNEVAEKDKEKMMKKMDKLWKMNHELKKKNEMMWKCNVLCMVVIGLLLVLWLGSWKSTYGRMLYLP
ncbi:hypothetical protein RHMOL_Rhmol02G0060900 [Rhododendron molle]|uniref:Uncharacterized protein n=1 Tax=Rhododendron molle TaxID=49168 RepID=A0ACC0PME8_RHOML|nr:hypothetical protein RHMOL_Rhmol02G0060900 [Rhododendron molle]